MNVLNAKPTGTASPVTVAGAVMTDAVLILVFAAIGRDAHQRGDVVAGVLLTAWPFLAGAAAGWLITCAWRHPLSVRKAGIGVWLGSLVVGMLLRAITNQTVVLPFVIVALISLGVLLLGYRLVISAYHRRKSA
ncbi:DUF3054 domain-containing protein [Pseudarthrobacter sp. NamE2]|uniref:DUF3054 domain-containing protein n=1 Tax=Pseudarthrobacter sp. NamE2 TaxID=2576838 RepID=UPI0010FF4F6A|nr:DUF3054 domain-containing protein [Pseudarthrobacter sp. NamE2]